MLCVVTFHSTHNALKAEKLFKRENIKVSMIPVPREFSSNCGIAACVSWNRKNKIKEILEEEKVGIENIHKWIKN